MHNIQRQKIFISYRTKETTQIAGRLYEKLAEQFGSDYVFRDADGIDFGENYTKKLEDELDLTAVVLLLIGETWVKQYDNSGRRRIDQPTDWVRKEIEYAFENNIQIIPLLIDNERQLSEDDNLPLSINKLLKIKSYSLRSNFFTVDIVPIIEKISEKLPLLKAHDLPSGMEESLIGKYLDNDRYKIEQWLGGGGFGNVFLAIDNGQSSDGFKQEVAIKILHRYLAQDEISRRRFRSGASAMQLCSNSAYITNVLRDVTVDDKLGCYYFVMEYISGTNLWKWVARKKYTWEEILPVIKGIAKGLCDAWNRGKIVHRDIKPQNILLTDDEQPNVKITDFDLVLNENSRKTRVAPLGSFLYAAPEALLDGSQADRRSDVYSLAMTMVYCFYGEDIPAEVLREFDGFLVSLECPEVFKRVLRKALSQSPDDRHKSVEDLLADLRFAEQKLKQFVQLQAVEKVDFVREVKLNISRDLSLDMFALPEGQFKMGSPIDETGRGSDEKIHLRNIVSFWISKAPVTRELWQSVMSWDNHFPSWGYRDSELLQLPVHGVSFWDALRFLNALSDLFGLQPCYRIKDGSASWNIAADGFRLPTEGEWEYAARAGVSGLVYPADASLSEQAWFLDNSDRCPHPVGLLEPNAWGIYDMSGNVWEWVWDWYGEYPNQALETYIGPDSGDSRVIRGGGNRSAPVELRNAHRDRMNPNVRDADFGFRCVRGPLNK